jgi:hypothetical protein
LWGLIASSKVRKLKGMENFFGRGFRADQILVCLLVSILTGSHALATTVEMKPALSEEPDVPTLLGDGPPYVPRNSDYSIETGLLGGRDELFWIGGVIGKHLGRCIFTESHTCQQYLDGIFGLGAREGETQMHFMGSLRWQYVNFPKRHSPHWRLMLGPAQISRNGDLFWRPAFGGGYGVTTYLHDKVDLRLEARAVVTDRVFVEGLIGFQFKVDRLLSVFGSKLKDLGYGTMGTVIEATGTAIKATGEGIEGIVEGVSTPFKKEEPAAPPAPQPAPQPTPRKPKPRR